MASYLPSVTVTCPGCSTLVMVPVSYSAKAGLNFDWLFACMGCREARVFTMPVVVYRVLERNGGLEAAVSEGLNLASKERSIRETRREEAAW